MSKRRTGKPLRRPRPQVLEVRVMSPRIAWYGFLKLAGKLTKLALVLLALAGVGWGVWVGIQRAFYKNPDFRLQVIDLNPNPVIDEAGVAKATGIDLTASLFDIDVTTVVRKLKELPGISDASAERHLPGKLVVRVVPRAPKAWVICPESGLTETRRAGAMLVDRGGVAYPCPDLQLEAAMNLPVIRLPRSEAHLIAAGKRCEQTELGNCFRLLDSAVEADSDSVRWIDSIEQVNAWSLLLKTRDGIEATFALGDHERQMRNLRAAMDHASEKGYAIHTINLIPKHNIPVTTRDETAGAPRAVPVVEPSAEEVREARRVRDVGNLLNRN